MSSIAVTYSCEVNRVDNDPVISPCNLHSGVLHHQLSGVSGSDTNFLVLTAEEEKEEEDEDEEEEL